MEDFIKPIVEFLIKDYPALILTLGVLYIILLFLKELKIIFVNKDGEKESLFVKIKNYLISLLKKRKLKIVNPEHIVYTDEMRKERKDKLEIHNFFQQVNNMKNSIPSMNFGSIRKNEIFRDVIMIYVETISNDVLNIIKNNNFDELKTNEMNKLFSDGITTCTNHIYSNMRTRLGEPLYNKLIEDPVKGFRAKNAIFRDVFINGVLYMSNQHMSVYNYDNYERATEILTSMYISLQVIVKNFEQVFKDYNGELDQYLK